MAAPDLIDSIIAYESGELTDAETLALFGQLIATGMAWQLQGSYGRAAAALIENSWLSSDGEILRDPDDD